MRLNPFENRDLTWSYARYDAQTIIPQAKRVMKQEATFACMAEISYLPTRPAQNKHRFVTEFPPIRETNVTRIRACAHSANWRTDRYITFLSFPSSFQRRRSPFSSHVFVFANLKATNVNGVVWSRREVARRNRPCSASSLREFPLLAQWSKLFETHHASLHVCSCSRTVSRYWQVRQVHYSPPRCIYRSLCLYI